MEDQLRNIGSESAPKDSFQPKVRKYSEGLFTNKSDEIKPKLNPTSQLDKKKHKKPKNQLLNELDELKRMPIYEKALEECIRLEKEYARGKPIEVNLSMQFNTAFGERVIIVGGHELLGE